MMSILKKWHKCLTKKTIILSILCSLYFSAVTTISIVENIKNVATVVIALWAVFYGAIIYFLNRIEVKQEKFNSISIRKHPKRIFFICLIIIFLGQLLYWLAYFPGGFNLDAYGQWDQVHGLSHINNWHPVFTTFIYWILTRIVDSLAFCIFVQIMAFSISMSFLMRELCINGISDIYLVIASIIIAINPAIGMNNICLIKDALFAIDIIWIFISVVRIYASNGIWLRKKTHMLVFMAELLALLQIRHNSGFFIIPLVILICFFYRKEIMQIIVVSICTIICFFIIEGPLFSFLEVEPHSNIVGESVGIPMSIMANALLNDYNNVPEEVKDFLLDIADYEEWKRNYIIGEWDSCKWEFGGTELLKEESLDEIIKLTLKTVIACPETSYLSIRENTRVVWQVIGYSEWDTWVYIENNDYQIVPKENKLCKRIVKAILECSDSLIGSTVIWNIGFLIVLFMTGLLIAFKAKNYHAGIFIIPILVYDFLTMLMLCGSSHRYFYFNSVLILPLMAILLKGFGNKIFIKIKVREE